MNKYAIIGNYFDKTESKSYSIEFVDSAREKFIDWCIETGFDNQINSKITKGPLEKMKQDFMKDIGPSLRDSLTSLVA